MSHTPTSLITAAGLAIALLIAAIWGGAVIYTSMYADVAPRQAEAERKVYVNTPSYINGKNEILMKYISEHRKAKDDLERNALKEQILNEAATVDIEKLTPHIRDYITNL